MYRDEGNITCVYVQLSSFHSIFFFYVSLYCMGQQCVFFSNVSRRGKDKKKWISCYLVYFDVFSSWCTYWAHIVVFICYSNVLARLIIPSFCFIFTKFVIFVIHFFLVFVISSFASICYSNFVLFICNSKFLHYLIVQIFLYFSVPLRMFPEDRKQHEEEKAKFKSLW